MSALHSRRQAASELAVTQMPIAALAPNPHNPRLHTPRQVKQIARSIEAFGFNVPVLIDGDGRIIAGHGRVQACEVLGWTEVPTIRLDHLSPTQAKAFMIADNRLTDCSSWNDIILGETLAELAAVDLDFSIEATGFHMAEIDLRIEGLQGAAAKPDPADSFAAPSGPAVSRGGDLWVLGRHRLLCGKALEAEGYAALMAGQRAAAVFTGPPYNVPIQGHVSGLGAVHHREFAMASGEMTPEAFTSFLRTALGHLAANSMDGALHYVCMDWRHMGELLAAGSSVYGDLKNLCVWAKDNAGMGTLYRSQHELVFVFKNGTAPHRNNVELGRHGRNRSNVWNYPGVNSFGRRGEEGNLLAMHPTVKPVALVADALLDSTARGDLVLDPFLGSGSTLIAAERVGRRCHGMELDPLYADTIIRRWQAFSGDTALHATSGLNFQAVAAERAAANAKEADHG